MPSVQMMMSSPDPLYYLRNFEEAITCVLARSGDLLSESEALRGNSPFCRCRLERCWFGS